MINIIEYSLAVAIITIISIVTVGACLLLAPIRWLIDISSKKDKIYCSKCSDRKQFLELIYYYPPGNYVCSKCKNSFKLERECLSC